MSRNHKASLAVTALVDPMGARRSSRYPISPLAEYSNHCICFSGRHTYQAMSGNIQFCVTLGGGQHAHSGR